MTILNKTEVQPRWVLTNLYFLIGCDLCYFLGAPYFALAILILTIQSVFHEFVHAFAAWRTNSKIQKIFLGRPHPYIDFIPSSRQAEKNIYFYGFAFQFFLIVLACLIMLYGCEVTGNKFYAIVGILLLVLFVLEGIIPDGSDFRRI